MDGVVVCRFKGPFYSHESDEMIVAVYMTIGPVMKVVHMPLGKRTEVDPERDVLPAIHMLAAEFSKGQS